MEKKRDAARRKKESERLRRMAREAHCMVCGQEVGVEDRCSDGNYLHRECAFKSSQRLNVQTSG